jgi:hypothetical protein
MHLDEFCLREPTDDRSDDGHQQTQHQKRDRDTARYPTPRIIGNQPCAKNQAAESVGKNADQGFEFLRPSKYSCVASSSLIVVSVEFMGWPVREVFDRVSA